jgi:Ca-activated chloride channel family protein
MAAFQFQYPAHLYLFFALPVLLLLLAAYRVWRKKAVARLGAPERKLPFSSSLFWLKNGLFMLALAFLALAWANPQRGAKKQKVTQQAADVFIALDISKSMLCQDVLPSRLELARVFTQELVQTLEGNRVGLIFFAGDAFLQMPLSTDYSFTLQSLQSASPDLLTEQGTAIAAAIELAEKSFDSEPGGGRALILITDGENHDEEALERTEKAFENGTMVYAVGAGTATGGPIPAGAFGESQFKKDEKGEVVRTKLNEKLLHELALAGGGQAFNLGQGERAIGALRRAVEDLQKREIEVRSLSEFESWYRWFLLPALLLLLLERLISFKKRGVFMILALFSFGALSAQDPHAQLRQGDDAYTKQRYKAAEKHYREAADLKYSDPQALYNLGNALYQQGNWADAATRFEQAANGTSSNAARADALHNLGNAQLKQQKYQEAVQAYEQSLRLRPGDAGTKQNLQMAKKRLKEAQQKQQQQQQNQPQQPQEQNQDQQQNQPSQPSQQPQNQPPNEQGQPQQPPEKPQQPQPQNADKLKKEDAKRLLETAVGPDDQKNARKYRSAQQQPKPKGAKKDW